MKIYVPFSSHHDTVCSCVGSRRVRILTLCFIIVIIARNREREKRLQNDKIGRVIELIKIFFTTVLISDSLELFFHFSFF